VNRLSFGVGLFPTEPLPAMVHLATLYQGVAQGAGSENAEATGH